MPKNIVCANGHDARIAEEEVVARRQHDEVEDLRGRIQGLRAGEQERREQEPDEDREEQGR
jgi:hypothetical protein